MTTGKGNGVTTMSKKHDSSLYNAPRTIEDIDTLASDDSIRIDRRAKKRLLGRLRNKTFRW
ncbi:MAG: hypothetical protein ABR985_16625 [Methanotrichaceae archaeon]|jgi:hypothetical protein